MSKANASKEETIEIVLTSEIKQLEENFMAVQYDEDYGFDDFLAQGGASSDAGVVKFLTDDLLWGSGLDFLGDIFGCSTFAAADADGNALFGRNFQRRIVSPASCRFSHHGQSRLDGAF